MYIFLDIETLPAMTRDEYNKNNPIEFGDEPTFDTIKAAGNIKDPIKIEADKKKKLQKALEEYDKNSVKLQEEQDKNYRKLALNPMYGRILSISAIFDTGAVFKYTVGYKREGKPNINNEYELLKYFITSVNSQISKKEQDGSDVQFVGHNIIFDLTFLRYRILLNELYSNMKFILPLSKYSDDIIDTQRMIDIYSFSKYIKLDDLCDFFGIKGKGNIDGSKVYDYYKAGKLEEINEYCYDDTYKVLLLFNKMATMCGINNYTTLKLEEKIAKPVEVKTTLKFNSNL